MPELIRWSELLLRLGVEVWKAIERGDTGRTVSDVFAGVSLDADELVRLEHVAQLHYVARSGRAAFEAYKAAGLAVGDWEHMADEVREGWTKAAIAARRA